MFKSSKILIAVSNVCSVSLVTYDSDVLKFQENELFNLFIS
jgi:hypothetical protein